MDTEQTRVLVVEDDSDIVDLLYKILSSEGYHVQSLREGDKVFDKVSEFQPHLLLLDLGLPKLDGIEVCKKVREKYDLPIVMLTARDSTDSYVKGLDAGADDYVTKPFHREELLARVRAHLRRNPPTTEKEEDNGFQKIMDDLFLDTKACCFYRGDRNLDLTKGEYKMLSYLLERKEEVISREELLKQVWGWEALNQGTNTVDMFVSNLRKKMEAGGEKRLLKTRHGLGYILSE